MWASSLSERLSAAGPILLPVLLDAGIKGIVILSLTAVVTLAMRGAAAAARHLVWFLGTLSLLFLPILSAALPGWYILPRWAIYDAAPSPQTPQVVPTPALVPSEPDTQVPPIETPLRTQTNIPAMAPAAPVPSAPAPPAGPTPVRLGWPGWAVLAWLAGCVLYLGYVAMGSVSLWWLQRRSSRITIGPWPILLREACGQLRFRRPVELISSPCRAMPMTWGLWRTRLLLPEDSVNWTAEQRRAVLLHELAHAKRLDCLTQFLVQIACALYWFNPMVWLASRRMQAERELACDDMVLTTGARASAYAEQLLHIASEVRAVRFSAAAIAMARPSKLEDRLRAILDTRRNRRLAARTVVVVSLAIGISALALAALRAHDTPASPVIPPVRRWAADHGWESQEITKTALTTGDRWRDLPFSLSKDEETDTRACVELAKKSRTFVNGKAEFPGANTRAALEDLLKRRPGYFYAEFLLGQWHRDQGDDQAAARLLDTACRHAPVVIVQRFEFADGSPLSNTAISAFALECNRTDKGSLDQTLQLFYPDLRTDADGCIYLPVYNTVYRTDDIASPAGYTVTWPTLGFFQTSHKVAMLPAAIVVAKPGDFVPAASAAKATSATAKLPGDNAVELLAVSPYPDPLNAWWLPDGSASTRQYQTREPGSEPWPAENGWRFVFRFAKALERDSHLQFRFSIPEDNVNHYTNVRKQDLDKPFVLFAVFPTHPKKVTIRLGQTSGPWKALAQYDAAAGKTTGDLPAGFEFKDARDTDKDFSRVSIVHPVTDLELRVVAIDSENQAHSADASWLSGEDPAITNFFQFKHLPLARIRSFRLETRDYQWVEFENISLKPAAVPSSQPAAAHSTGTAPQFDHGRWNMPLIGYVRNRSPNAALRPGPWFTIANSDLSESAQVNPLELGLPADAPIEEISKRTKGGDLYEPELGVIEPIRGTLVAPLDLPGDPSVVEPVAFEKGVASMTCEEIATRVRSYSRTHEATPSHLKEGEHYAILRADGGLSVMDVHGRGEQMYVTLIPIGAVAPANNVALPAILPASKPATPLTRTRPVVAPPAQSGAAMESLHNSPPATVPATQGAEPLRSQAAIQAVRTITYSRYEPEPGRADMGLRVLIKDGRQRMENPDGTVVIKNAIESKALFLDPAHKEVTISALVDVHPDDPVFTVANIEKMAEPGRYPVVPLGKLQIGGLEADGIRFNVGGEQRTVWLNTATHRPVQIETELASNPATGKPLHLIYRDIVLDPALDDQLFTVLPPPGYKVMGRPLEKLDSIHVPATRPATRPGMPPAATQPVPTVSGPNGLPVTLPRGDAGR